MNVRVPADLRARLKAAARRRGVSQSILVRSALEQAAASTADLPGLLPERSHAAQPGQPAPAAQTTDSELVYWLAERTGMPRAIVRLSIAGGRVRIDGEDARHVERVPPEGAQVTLDGRPV